MPFCPGARGKKCVTKLDTRAAAEAVKDAGGSLLPPSLQNKCASLWDAANGLSLIHL